MATTYAYRYFIFVVASKLNTANQQAKAWDPDTGGGETFGSVLLSASGAMPATHYGCSTAATTGMRTKILDAFSHVPFYRIYSEAGGWTWGKALADMGLTVITKGVLS